MYEPTVLTDDGLKQWAEEQERYAAAIPPGDPRHDNAVFIQVYAKEILAKLAQPMPAQLQRRMEARQREILRDLRDEWHQIKPTTEPPGREFNVKAERQAYREMRADIMRLVDRIIILRTVAEAPRGRS